MGTGGEDNSSIRRLGVLLRPDVGRLSAAVFTLVGLAAVNMLFPLPIKLLLDDIFPHSNWTLLWLTLLGLVLLYLARNVLYFYSKTAAVHIGENVTIGPDRHLRINDRRLSSIDRGFEFVYSHAKDSNRMPLDPAIKSVYSGHELVNDFHYRGPDLSNSKSPYKVPKNHLIFFGDNTANSMDSRSWGALPKKNVIGHSSFVYWPPLSPRFGWSHR